MSDEMDFFDDIAGDYCPTALLKGIGDVVKGEVVETRTRDHIPFGKKDPEILDNGKVRKELVVIIQTEDRNWANVVKVPKVDPEDDKSPDKPGSEDDGKRAIYIPQSSNIQYAIGRALRDAGVKKGEGIAEGAMLAVKIENLKDTGKGNPLKEHKAFYKAPAKTSDPFVADVPKEEKKEESKSPWGDTAPSGMPF